MAIGDRINLRLRDLGISQSELARRAGLAQSTINTLINRDTRSSPHLMKLATALRTTPAFLLEETDDPESEIAEAGISFEERQLITLTRALDREDFEALAQLARSLARAAAVGGPSAMREGGSATLHDRQLSFNR